MPNGKRKVHHPLLGEVDIEDGPSVLEEHERKLVAPGVAPEPETIFPTPEPVPQPPSVLRITRRILAAGLRRLSRLADKLDEGE